MADRARGGQGARAARRHRRLRGRSALTLARAGEDAARTEDAGPYVVVYDGHCRICTRLARVLERWDAGARLDVVASQAPGVQARFPWIPPRAYGESLQLVEPSGRTFSGAAAIERLLDLLPRGRWIAWLFSVPLVRPLAERLYRWFARNRYQLGCGEHCRYQPPDAGSRDG